jgi:hypothetical protein
MADLPRYLAVHRTALAPGVYTPPSEPSWALYELHIASTTSIQQNSERLWRPGIRLPLRFLCADVDRARCCLETFSAPRRLHLTHLRTSTRDTPPQFPAPHPWPNSRLISMDHARLVRLTPLSVSHSPTSSIASRRKAQHGHARKLDRQLLDRHIRRPRFGIICAASSA